MKNFVIDDGSVNGGIRIYGMPDDVEVVNVKKEWFLMKRQSDGTYRDYLPISSLGVKFIDYISPKDNDGYYVVGGNDFKNYPYLHTYKGIYSSLLSSFVFEGDRDDVVYDFHIKRGVYGFTKAGSTKLYLAASNIQEVDFRERFLNEISHHGMNFDPKQLQISITTGLSEGGPSYFDATFNFSDVEKVHAGFLVDDDMNLSFFPYVFSEQAFQEHSLSNEENMLSLDDFYSSFADSELVARLYTLLNYQLRAQRHEDIGKIMGKRIGAMPTLSNHPKKD